MFKFNYRPSLYFIITLCMILTALPIHAKINSRFIKPAVDSTDPTMATKAKEAQTVNPTKIAATPGRIKVYSTNNTFGFGILGSTTATKNIYLQPADETYNAGDVMILGTPYESTVNGEAASIIPFTYGTVAGGTGSSVSINAATVTDPNFVNGTEINITNNAGSITSSINNGSITTAKLSAASVVNATEMNAEGIINLDDTTVMTSGAVYALVAQILGLPSLTISTPPDGATVTDSLYDGFTGTATDPDGSIVSVEWKLETGGTYSAAGVTGTSNWSIADLPMGSAGVKNVYIRATDNEGNVQEKVKTITYTIADTTAPVLVAGTDSTHDGVTPISGIVVLTEINRASPAVTFTATNCTPASGSCTGTYPNYSTPSLTPTGTGNIVITYSAVDLTGNTATGSDLTQQFIYSGGAGHDDVILHLNGDGTVAAGVYTVAATELAGGNGTTGSGGSVSTGAALIGSNGFTLPTTSDNISIPFTIADAGHFTLAFRIKMPTFTVSAAQICGLQNADVSRYCAIVCINDGDSNEFQLLYREAGGAVRTIATDNANLASNTEYIVTIDANNVTPLIKLSIYNTSYDLLDSTQYTTAFTAPTFTRFLMQSGVSLSTGLYIDNVMFSDLSNPRNFITDTIGGVRMVDINDKP